MCDAFDDVDFVLSYHSYIYTQANTVDFITRLPELTVSGGEKNSRVGAYDVYSLLSPCYRSSSLSVLRER